MENLIKFMIMIGNFVAFCLGLMTFIIIIFRMAVSDNEMEFRNINSTKRNRR